MKVILISFFFYIFNFFNILYAEESIKILNKNINNKEKNKTVNILTDEKSNIVTEKANVEKEHKVENNYHFTTAIKDRKPIDVLEGEISFYDIKRVSFFSTIKNQKGKTVSHVWYNDDKQVFKKVFDVKGDRWRVYTNVGLPYKYKVGDTILVKVVTEDKKEIAKKEIKIVR